MDWWCLGVLLYELTTGKVPFTGSIPNTIYHKIMQASVNITFPSGHVLSTYCQDLIIALLNEDPTQRLGSGINQIRDIQKHTWFNGLNWDALYAKEVETLYKGGPIVFEKKLEKVEYSDEFMDWYKYGRM